MRTNRIAGRMKWLWGLVGGALLLAALLAMAIASTAGAARVPQAGHDQRGEARRGLPAVQQAAVPAPVPEQSLHETGSLDSDGGQGQSPGAR